jgi:hypothetical protein
MQAPKVGDRLEIQGVEVEVVAVNGGDVQVVPVDVEAFMRDHAELLEGPPTMVEVEESVDVSLPPIKLDFTIEDALYVQALMNAGKIEPLI